MSDFTELFIDLFAGRPDVYAIRWEWETAEGITAIYIPSVYTGDSENSAEQSRKVAESVGTHEYGVEAVKAHLSGNHFLGVYPVHADSTVRWFALDFDKDREGAWKAALRQQEIFRDEAGLETYIECSRSGNGFHLWGFLEEPVNAGLLRHALAQFIEEQDTYDRMFPNQDGVTEARPLGNLIALPLFGTTVKDGKGVFVVKNAAGAPVPVDDQRGYLTKVMKISHAKIEELFEEAPETYSPKADVPVREGPAEEGHKGAYKVVHEDLGCEWIRWCCENPEELQEPEWYAFACQLAQLEGGRNLFHEYSARDTARYTPKDTDIKFDHAIRQNAPQTCNYIRDEFDGPCCRCCDKYPVVKHPFDLSRVPFYTLLQDYELEGEVGVMSAWGKVKTWAKEIFKDPGKFMGFTYGIPPVDEKTSLRPDDLIVAAARPGMGKTAFMNNIATHNAKGGNNVFIFSMEMTEEQLTRRMAVELAEVNATRLFTGQMKYGEWRRFLNTMEDLEENPLPIWIDDVTYDSEAIINRAADLIGEHGPGIVMLDYVQFIENRPGESEYEKNSRVPRELKKLAKLLHVPVFVLAQMNRQADDAKGDSNAFFKWIEGSGKIEQAADVIFFLLGDEEPGIVPRTLLFKKERHREAHDRVELEFNQPFMKFAPLGTWTQRGQVAHGAVGAGFTQRHSNDFMAA